jgi:predicted flap endonuclease-1-like 5' DNA nuclease
VIATIGSMQGQDDGGFPRGIGAPATRALHGAGYTQLRQLAGVPVADLRKLHGMGPKALRVLQEALEEQGLSLG